MARYLAPKGQSNSWLTKRRAELKDLELPSSRNSCLEHRFKDIYARRRSVCLGIRRASKFRRSSEDRSLKRVSKRASEVERQFRLQLGSFNSCRRLLRDFLAANPRHVRSRRVQVKRKTFPAPVSVIRVLSQLPAN